MLQTAIISIPLGRMDSTNYQPYLKNIERAINEGCQQVIVDLSQVTFLDTYGLSVLVKGWRLAQKKEIPFRARGVKQEPVKIVFKITDIERLFPVEYDLVHK